VVDVLAADEEVAEVLLLLPAWQARALEFAAAQCGLSAAQLLRRLVRNFLREQRLTAKAGISVL
jgi:hypothetical protein